MANAGAIGGGALGGAGTGAAVAGPYGAVAGAIIGGLSGLFSSNDEENQRKLQMLVRAADQRAAPWLAKAGVHTELTPYAMGKSHAGDVLQGGLNGFQAFQSGKNAASENQYRESMRQLLLNQQAPPQTKALMSMPNVASSQGGSGMDDLVAQYLAANAGRS